MQTHSVPEKIRLGTRGSPLALLQTNMVGAALRRAFPGISIENVIIHTSGDWNPASGENRLSIQQGGKGLFVKEIEEALLAGQIDAAVHSSKDMPSFLPRGLQMAHMLPRADARDAVLLRQDWRGKFKDLRDIPHGAVVGTASVRRGAMVKRLRPDLQIQPFRGNVQTRITKVREGQVDVTFLAMAGLVRLGLDAEVDMILPTDMCLPGAGQGAVGIETRCDNFPLKKCLDAISCSTTVTCVSAERAALAVLDGSCHTPIGAYAELKSDRLVLTIEVLAIDGSQRYSVSESCVCIDEKSPQEFGHNLALNFKQTIPVDLLQAIIS